MNQLLKKRVTLGSILAAAMIVVSAGALAGDVGSTGRDVNQVYGRGAGMPVQSSNAVHVTRKATVGEIEGRGSRIPEPVASTVGTSQADVEQFGRGSPLPMAKARMEGDALAQKR